MKTKNKQTKRKQTKRNYTARGTTVKATRVVLMDGKPVGRGKPSLDGKGERKVVYVPVGDVYKAEVHGAGVRFNKHFHGVWKRLPVTVMAYTHKPEPITVPVQLEEAVAS